jgi:hypothetical protein
LKKFVFIASLAASLAMATAAQATQFVTNGNFASLTNGLGLIGHGGTTTATGWTTTGYNIVFNNATTSLNSVALWDASNGGSNSWTGTAPGGVNFVAMDGDYGTNTAPITQTITGLTVGNTYTLSFEYAFAQQKGYGGATSQNISASFGGTTIFTSSPNYALPSYGFSGWSTETLNVTATNSSEVLSFLAYGNLPVPPFALLTGVSLTGAVPEPATWAMMIVGLGAMGVAARRRRRMLATA